jgi:hypothetical protein
MRCYCNLPMEVLLAAPEAEPKAAIARPVAALTA